MIYLLSSIISSTLIFITFKTSEKYKANLIHIITINYLVATILGFSANKYEFSFSNLLEFDWLPIAVLIGILFLLMFYLIGYSTQKSGVAVTTIAGKMSLVIPVIFSIIYYKEKLGFLKLSGLVLATTGVILASFKPITRHKNAFLIFLPLLIFIGSGFTDSVVKFTQESYITDNLALLFSSFVFLSALILGIFTSFVIKHDTFKSFTKHEIIAGATLGLANFGSLYFFILALDKSKIDSSIIFGLNNISIVLLSVLFGRTIFNEKLTTLNYAGISIAITAIVILMNV